MKEAFIIGKDVSKGARSPVLWNACFEHFKIDASMGAIDIESDIELMTFLNEQLNNSNFLGAAVASPIKENVSNFFIENFNIDFYGPANCFYKFNDKYSVLNTDTLAALETISIYFPGQNFSDVAILGSGAVAKSLAYNLKDHNSSKTIYARSDEHFETLKSFNFECKKFSDINLNFNQHQIVVNCTSLGRDGKNNESPIDEEVLSGSNSKNSFVFDVNYINSPSQLLKTCSLNGIPNVDGSRMNLMQAAIAFGHANQLVDVKDEILKVMESAIL
tara:strand:- start:22252 stop:23076 length:825 start_codon:yes stop_codon:yes gene_type:complete